MQKLYFLIEGVQFHLFSSSSHTSVVDGQGPSETLPIRSTNGIDSAISSQAHILTGAV